MKASMRVVAVATLALITLVACGAPPVQAPTGTIPANSPIATISTPAPTTAGPATTTSTTTPRVAVATTTHTTKAPAKSHTPVSRKKSLKKRTPPKYGYQCRTGDERKYAICAAHDDWVDGQVEFDNCMSNGGTWDVDKQKCIHKK